MLIFNLTETIILLERTPRVLNAMLSGLPDKWLYANEGHETWSPFDIVGHLIHGEKTDWIARTRMILEKGTSQPFKPFDRFAQFEESKNKSISDLLEEFEQLRKENLHALRQLNLTPADLQKKGLHPDFGEITLKQLLATWATHDLSHIRQISRVMAKQYKTDIGPWAKYLPVVSE